MADVSDTWLLFALTMGAKNLITRRQLAIAGRRGRVWSGPGWDFARALQYALERGYFHRPGPFAIWSRKPASLTPAGLARLRLDGPATFDRFVVREQEDDRG